MKIQYRKILNENFLCRPFVYTSHYNFKIIYFTNINIIKILLMYHHLFNYLNLYKNGIYYY